MESKPSKKTEEEKAREKEDKKRQKDILIRQLLTEKNIPEANWEQYISAIMMDPNFNRMSTQGLEKKISNIIAVTEPAAAASVPQETENERKIREGRQMIGIFLETIPPENRHLYNKLTEIDLTRVYGHDLQQIIIKEQHIVEGRRIINAFLETISPENRHRYNRLTEIRDRDL